MHDAIALAIQGCHDMNNTRQQAMKKELNKDFAALCNSSTVDASSEFLFGNLCKLARYYGCQQTNKESAPHASTRQLQPQQQIYCWWTLGL